MVKVKPDGAHMKKYRTDNLGKFLAEHQLPEGEEDLSVSKKVKARAKAGEKRQLDNETLQANARATERLPEKEWWHPDRVKSDVKEKDGKRRVVIKEREKKRAREEVAREQDKDDEDDQINAKLKIPVHHKRPKGYWMGKGGVSRGGGWRRVDASGCKQCLL